MQKQLQKEFNLSEQHAVELFNHIVDSRDAGMDGAGIVSSALNLLHKGFNKIAGLKSKKQPDAKYVYKLKKGENHAVLYDPVSGKSLRARFMGPGTHVIENSRELINKYGSIKNAVNRDNFITRGELEAWAHDNRYYLISEIDDQKAKNEAERKADEKFVSVLKSALEKPDEKAINIQPALKAIQAKIAAEKLGIFKQGKFIDPKSEKSPADIQMVKDILAELEQQGYGPVEKIRPSRVQIPLVTDRIECETCGRTVQRKNLNVHKKTKICRRARGEDVDDNRFNNNT